MTKQTLVLAKQEHIENGNLPQPYLVPVFDAGLQGLEFWVDAKEFKGIDLKKEVTKVVEIETPKKQPKSKMEKLLDMLYNQCTVNNDYITVDIDQLDLYNDRDDWNEFDTLFNRIAFEHNNHSTIHGDEVVENGILTERQLNSYLNKLAKFIVKYAPKYCSPSHAEKLVKEFK